MKIDVLMPTCNSETFLKPVLDSVYQEIPVCHLILVDGYSKDKTLEIAKQYPNVKIIQSRESLGKCREIGIKKVDTEWFAFIDSDVVLKPGWLATIKGLIAEDIGAVEGLDETMDPRRRAFQIGMSRLRKKLRSGNHPNKSKRAFTGDTLIRTETIRNIEIPSFLKVYEDQYIRDHIEKQGYRWVKTDDYLCLHYDFKPASRTVLAGEIAYRASYSRLRDHFLNLIKILPKVLYAFYITRTWQMIPYQIAWYIGYLKGGLKGKAKGRFQPISCARVLRK